MLGAIGIVLGVLALVIPLFGALGSCVPFVDAACNDACTPCTDEEKKVSCHLFCGDLGGIWGESSLVVALANLRLGGQSLPKLSSLKVAGTDAACNSATLDCRQPGNGIEMYCSNGTLGIDSKLKTSRLKLHVRSGPVLAKPLALFSSTWWCSVGQPVSWALWEPAWLAAFAASAAKPSLMIRG